MGSLCAGCLASDRKLCILRKDVHKLGLELFQSIGQKTVSQKKLEEDILLCWECHSMIVNIHKFQQKVKKAQEILKKKNKYKNVECLSTLSVVTQTYYFDGDMYDSIIKQEDDEIERGFPIHFKQYEIDTTVVPIDYDEIKTAKKEEGNLGAFDDILNEDNVMDDPNDSADIKQEFHAQASSRNANSIFVNSFEDEFDTETGLEIQVKQEPKKTGTHKTGKWIRKLGPPKKGANASYEIVSLKNAPQVNQNNLLGTLYTKIVIDQKEVKDLRKSFTSRKRKLRLECDKCSARFATNVGLQIHFRKFHLEESGKFLCDICGKRMKSLQIMARHCREHFLKFQCLICHKICSPRSVMHSHLQTHYKVFRCIICRLTFSKRQEFNEHYKEQHSEMICDHCGFKTSNRQSIEKHIMRKHLEHTNTNKCHECNKEFAKRSHLTQHNRFHHTESKTPEESYCVECDMHFKNKTRLSHHISDRHQRKKKQIPCPECDNVYSKNCFMMNHYNYVHLKRTKYYCDKCCMYFLNSTHRSRHMLRHGIGEVKRNKLCPHCGRAFPTPAVLNNHIRTHTGERPFECTFCSATFAQKYARSVHMKKQHKFGGASQV